MGFSFLTRWSTVSHMTWYWHSLEQSHPKRRLSSGWSLANSSSFSLELQFTLRHDRSRFLWMVLRSPRDARTSAALYMQNNTNSLGKIVLHVFQGGSITDKEWKEYKTNYCQTYWDSQLFFKNFKSKRWISNFKEFITCMLLYMKDCSHLQHK